MKIEIVDTKVNERKFEKNGKTLTFRSQKAFAHLEDQHYPVAFSLQLYDRSAYQVGFYTLGSDAFKIDKYDNLALKSSFTLHEIK